jgi:hypothetical protein
MSAKDIDLSKIVLTAGYHRTREEGMSALEAAAYLAGLEHSERPYGVCPVITEVMHWWNHHLPSDRTRTRLLVPLLPKILNTYATREILVRRAWMAVDWLVRVYTAAWLKRAGLAPHASALRALPPIVDVASGEASKEVTRAARAAWDAARHAALKAIRKANPAAVSDDSLNKAMRKAEAVGRYAAREAVRCCAGHAGSVTAEFIRWNPANYGEWMVMTRKLTRTVRILQASAVDLVERMAAMKSAAASVEGAGGGARTSTAPPTRAARRRSLRPRPRQISHGGSRS